VAALQRTCAELSAALTSSRAEVADLASYNDGVRRRYTDQMVRLEAAVADTEVELRAVEGEYARARRAWTAAESALKASARSPAV
jgi:hypothetical protein